ncbi:hypothetical protein M9458_032810, partial [Cirrhinus mrigala]
HLWRIILPSGGARGLAVIERCDWPDRGQVPAPLTRSVFLASRPLRWTVARAIFSA